LFPGSKRLFEIADSFEEIKSSCYCNSKTIFNARINNNGEIVTDGEQIEVGGDDRYVSLCRKCYFKKTGNIYYKKIDS
jgi:thymidine kinase